MKRTPQDMFIGQVLKMGLDSTSDIRLRDYHRQQAAITPKMQTSGGQLRHYAVAVRAGRETTVRDAMRSAGIDAWVPRTWAEKGQVSKRGGRPPKKKDLVLVIATPGYLVVCTEPTPEAFYGLLSFDDVIDMLGVQFESTSPQKANVVPILPLSRKEVNRLKQHEDIEKVDFSTEWRSPFAPGRKVRAKQGLLRGLVGKVSIKRATRGCVWVEFNVMGRASVWEIAVDDLQKWS